MLLAIITISQESFCHALKRFILTAQFGSSTWLALTLSSALRHRSALQGSVFFKLPPRYLRLLIAYCCTCIESNTVKKLIVDLDLRTRLNTLFPQVGLFPHLHISCWAISPMKSEWKTYYAGMHRTIIILLSVCRELGLQYIHVG